MREILVVFTCFLHFGVIDSYRDAYYCKKKDLGHCASREIRLQRQYCPHTLNRTCHTISSVTLHDEGEQTLVKHCNFTVSICRDVILRSGLPYLLCRSECNGAGTLPGFGYFIIAAAVAACALITMNLFV
uniref:UPAR/Ly6 domain-containing protein n=1 Tax=Ciona savignyi TaxID=51511 RepID=H2YGB4_CIOSA